VRNTDVASVSDYIAAKPEVIQGMLERVRGAVCKAVPGAEEKISYKIPTYKLHGRPVLYFAGWKRHYSLYPATAAVVMALKDELAAHAVSKGTIRFPLSEPIPARRIGRIARLRAKEVAAYEKGKARVRNKA
jgi:uncharacterized protein YdhG (YjbR/CyaY superfamily)